MLFWISPCLFISITCIICGPNHSSLWSHLDADAFSTPPSLIRVEWSRSGSLTCTWSLCGISLDNTRHQGLFSYSTQDGSHHIGHGLWGGLGVRGLEVWGSHHVELVLVLFTVTLGWVPQALKCTIYHPTDTLKGHAVEDVNRKHSSGVIYVNMYLNQQLRACLFVDNGLKWIAGKKR